jgi:RHS repeat-associated protein
MDEIDNGTWVRSELYADGHHVATANASGVVFIHSDWLGTERARTNMAGVLCQTETSEPFGDDAVPTGSCAVNTPGFFTGKPRDTESNLDDFGARYLSSQWGRWMSPDWSSAPSGVPYAAFTNPQSLNLYAYVGNDPIDGQDPYGHRGETHFPAILLGMGEAVDGLDAELEYAMLEAEAGNVSVTSDTTESSSASGTSEAQAINQQSQTTPASAPPVQQLDQQQNAGTGGTSTGGTPYSLNLGGVGVSGSVSRVDFTDGETGIKITGNTEGCPSTCMWVSTYQRTGSTTEGPTTDRDPGNTGPLYPFTGSPVNFADRPTVAASGYGSFTAVTTVGIADPKSKSFIPLGSMTYSFSVDKSRNLSVSMPQVASPGAVARSLGVLRSESPTWTIP